MAAASLHLNCNFLLFFQMYSYSALKNVHFSTFLPIQAKKKSKWDFLDFSVLETAHGCKWVVSMEKAEGSSGVSAKWHED